LGLGSISVQSAAAVAITGGSISGISPLPIASGGTAASTAAQARSNLGLASGATTEVGTMATQNSNAVNITGGSITGITALSIGVGGTGATGAAQALVNLGAASVTRSINTGSGLTGGGDLSADRTIAIASNSNGFGTRTVSAASPTGGNNGDIWYQI
jgi:hypothetical protein